MGFFSPGDSTNRDPLDAYLSASWEKLLCDIADPTRTRMLTDTIAELEVHRVLDVGCGVGRMLVPLTISKEAFGVGVDVSAQACHMGRDFQAQHLPNTSVTFLRGAAEFLPFKAASFDVVACRLALPYTDNARCLAEIARVLRPGGLLLLRIRHIRYYLRQLGQGLISGDVRAMLHAVRVLVSGAIYHITKRRSHSRWLNETFQTRWLLRRELARNGMRIVREQVDSTPQAPDFLILRVPTVE